MLASNIVRKYINKVFVPTRADMFALQRLATLKLDFLPTSIESMRPAAVNLILNDIILNRRKTVLEFGSGVSTLYIAALIRHVGEGKLISFEHDKEWMKIVEAILSQNGLSEFVSLEYAPLVMDHPWVSKSKTSWYEAESVRKALSRVIVDLLVVDGPPAGNKLNGKNQLSRFPALPAVEPHMSSPCAVILDDFNRLGEQKIVKSWVEDFEGFDCLDYTLTTGTAYLRRGQGYVVTVQSR